MNSFRLLSDDCERAIRPSHFVRTVVTTFVSQSYTRLLARDIHDALLVRSSPLEITTNIGPFVLVRTAPLAFAGGPIGAGDI